MSFHASQIPQIPYPQKQASEAFGQHDLNRGQQGSLSLQQAMNKKKSKQQSKSHYMNTKLSHPDSNLDEYYNIQIHNKQKWYEHSKNEQLDEDSQ